jgi:hypothetical protein
MPPRSRRRAPQPRTPRSPRRVSGGRPVPGGARRRHSGPPGLKLADSKVSTSGVVIGMYEPAGRSSQYRSRRKHSLSATEPFAAQSQRGRCWPGVLLLGAGPHLELNTSHRPALTGTCRPRGRARGGRWPSPPEKILLRRDAGCRVIATGKADISGALPRQCLDADRWGSTDSQDMVRRRRPSSTPAET